MKRQRVAVIAGLIITIAVTGCGNSNTSVEPTESIIETEIEEAHATEEIEETETEKEHQLFNPDEIGKRGDKFWFEDEATIAYIMNIPGVSDLSDEELDAFMNELAELVSIDEFNGDVEQTESYIVSDLLPKYLEKQTVSKETKQPSSNTSTTQQQSSTKNNNSSSTDTETNNSNTQQQETQTPNNNESTPSNNTDSSANYSEGPITDLDREMLEHQDDPADWGGSAPGIQYTGHAAEDFGYSVGSTETTYYRGRDITLTYQGNDVWIDNEGCTWRTYVGVNGGLYWSTGIGG